MYLKIANDTKTKSYRLTESAEKPYIVVQTSKSDGGGTTTSKSYLPLTTKSGTGIRMNIKSGTETYRPLEYKSVSGSDTYSSSSEDVGNLSSTTALTRESTSNTVYETAMKPYSTVYGTKRVSAMTHGTKPSFTFIEYTRTYYPGYGTKHTIYGPTSMLMNGVPITAGSAAIAAAVSTTGLFTRTTGTTILSKTSTTATVYQTRSSTSGYTGVSSSSYETTGWE